MNKIEKIKEWVKKQKKEEFARNSIGVITGHTFFVDANELLSFLDTLSEEPDKSLEEEIKNYFQGYWPGTETVEQCNTDLHFTPPAIIRLASHFAEWQKSQMLKDAVEGEAVKIFEEGVASIHYNAFAIGEMAYFCKSDNIHLGQKVRIVVLKEEEE